MITVFRGTGRRDPTQEASDTVQPMSVDDSGISVYPPLPVPSSRREPQPPQPTPSPKPGRAPRRSAVDRQLIIMLAAAGVAGATAAWFLQPAIAPDVRISSATRRASDAEQAAGAQKDRADGLERMLAAVSKARRDAEAQLAVAESAQTELATRTAADDAQRKATEAILIHLRAAADKIADAVAIEGGEVHVRISERVLFKPNEDALTDRGKQVLTRVAAALKELPEAQVRVQGHTDDEPVPPPAAPRRIGRLIVPAPAPRFPTNWELSAARALAAVHYFQDITKLEPTRLVALAFGQYAPASKKDKALNRRLEIVVVAPRTQPREALR